MTQIGRARYLKAARLLLEKAGFSVTPMVNHLLKAETSETILFDVVGKNLPYQSDTGRNFFEWETWVEPERLERLEHAATEAGAKAMLLFTYAIRDDSYSTHFAGKCRLDGIEFGGKAISSADFRSNMIARSPSWSKVSLPHTAVLELTDDLACLDSSDREAN